MEIKSAIRRILNSTAESIYLLKYKKNIKTLTILVEMTNIIVRILINKRRWRIWKKIWKRQHFFPYFN